MLTDVLNLGFWSPSGEQNEDDGDGQPQRGFGQAVAGGGEGVALHRQVLHQQRQGSDPDNRQTVVAGHEQFGPGLGDQARTRVVTTPGSNERIATLRSTPASVPQIRCMARAIRCVLLGPVSGTTAETIAQ